ncbi:MAG: cache domain-containing protein [Flavobacteriaceae bacterium]|nr:cache domain-containing protein [Flavobacteriaceae bacterium]MCY4267679.1 cache domain-containing protein [Flavobacteriaceae bacterium]
MWKKGVSVPRLRNSFREEGGDWKFGSVYIWIVSDRDVNLFHGANQNLEHALTNFDRVDQDGQRFVEKLVNGARQNEDEGQFLEYTYDNPTNPNDGDEPKLGFTKSFELFEGQGKFVIGSGFYTGDLKVTAEEVKNDQTLEKFVNWAKSQIEPVTNVTEAAKIELQLRKKGDFNDGDDTYLIKVDKKNEDLLTHGKDRTLEGGNLSKVTPIKELIKAAKDGGGFVKYRDDGKDKNAYAVEYTDKITGTEYMLIGGDTKDLSANKDRELLEIEGIEKPEITASEVKDRETLEKFVNEAIKVLTAQFAKGKELSVPRLRNTFRKEGGHWKSGSVYIWIVSDQNINLFHGANQNLEHEFANLERLDDKGQEFVKILVNGARQNEEDGRFLEYSYDNPANENDGDEPKLGFAKSFPLLPGQKNFVVGSGIYTGDLNN